MKEGAGQISGGGGGTEFQVVGVQGPEAGVCWAGSTEREAAIARVCAHAGRCVWRPGGRGGRRAGGGLSGVPARVGQFVLNTNSDDAQDRGSGRGGGEKRGGGGSGRQGEEGEAAGGGDEETEEEGGEDGEAGSGTGVSGEQLGVRKGRRVTRWRGARRNVARSPRDLRASLPWKRKLELGAGGRGPAPIGPSLRAPPRPRPFLA